MPRSSASGAAHARYVDQGGGGCHQSVSVLEEDIRLRRAQPALAPRPNRKIREHVWIEELIDIAEEEASCELFAILKRPDEKYVTERSYDNPKFVEDMVRDIAGRLDQDRRVLGYVVESENFESIHNHSAYALIERDKEAEHGRKDCPLRPPTIFGSTPKTPLIGIHGKKKRFVERERRTSPSTCRWVTPSVTGGT